MVNYNQYDHIDLTEEETKIALYKAKREKDAKLKLTEYANKVNSVPEVFKFTYDEAYSFYRAKLRGMVGRDFILTDEQEAIFGILCEHFNSGIEENTSKQR